MTAISLALSFLGSLAFAGWWMWLRRTDVTKATAQAIADLGARLEALDAERGLLATRLGKVELELNMKGHR